MGAEGRWDAFEFSTFILFICYNKNKKFGCGVGEGIGIAESKMNEILHAFEIDYARLNLIANDFCQDIKRGLDREASPFKMLKSYLGLPRGKARAPAPDLSF